MITEEGDGPGDAPGAASDSAPGRIAAVLPGVRRGLPDAALLTAVVAVGTLVHPIGEQLDRPYWRDETWVAALARAPFGSIGGLNGSTPTGFMALVKFVPDSWPQGGRLVALAFTALGVAAAYVLVRRLAWPSATIARAAATAAGLVVGLAPATVQRNDLKQYTADACCALVLLIVADAVDRERPPYAVWWLGLALLAVFPFSTVAVFTGFAVFVGIGVRRLVARDLIGFAYAFGTGVGAGGLVLWWLAAVVLPAQPESLRDYWAPAYLHGSFGDVMTTVWSRLDAVSPRIGLAPLLAIALLAAGVVVLARLGSVAVAIAVPVLVVEMIVLGATDRYPFLDVRTSHFLFIVVLVTATIGVAGAVAALAHRRRALAIIVGVVVLGAYAAQARPYAGKLWIWDEDTRGQTEAVAGALRPGDVVVVGRGADYGFAYYWPAGRLDFRTADGPTGFRVRVRDVPALYAPDRTPDALADTMVDAVGLWRAAPDGARIFVVRSHLARGEDRIWSDVFAALGVRPRRLDVGREPLLVIGPPGPGEPGSPRVAPRPRPEPKAGATATLGVPDRRSLP
ncbi:MAG: hypothetical protein ACKOBG_06425 [Actinomycetota bacterium]